MNRKVKILGLLVAVFALSGVATASASAAEYHSEVATTFLQGNQVTTNVFATPAGNVKCKKAEFLGQQSTATATSLTIEPLYTECTAFGQNAEVTMNGCDYTFKPLSAASSTVEINCPTGKHITIDVPAGKCEVTVFPTLPTKDTVDTVAGGSGATRDLTVESTVEGIEIEPEGTGTICGATGVKTDKTSYTGTVTLKGFSNAGHTTQVGIWVQ